MAPVSDPGIMPLEAARRVQHADPTKIGVPYRLVYKMHSCIIAPQDLVLFSGTYEGVFKRDRSCAISRSFFERKILKLLGTGVLLVTLHF